MWKRYILVIMLTLMSINSFAITPGIRGRSKGDVIAARRDDDIAAWCDFNKQIVVTDLNVLCVYNGNG